LVLPARVAAPFFSKKVKKKLLIKSTNNGDRALVFNFYSEKYYEKV